MDDYVHYLPVHFHPRAIDRDHLSWLSYGALVFVLVVVLAPAPALAKPDVPAAAATAANKHTEVKSSKADSLIHTKPARHHHQKTRKPAKHKPGRANQQRLDEHDDVPFMQSSTAKWQHSPLLGARVLSDELQTLQIVNGLSYVLALTLGSARLLRFHRIYPCRGRSALVIFASRRRQRVIEAICLILIIPLAVREVGNFMLRQMRRPPQSVSQVRTGAIAERTPQADLVISDICSALASVPRVESYFPH